MKKVIVTILLAVAVMVVAGCFDGYGQLWSVETTPVGCIKCHRRPRAFIGSRVWREHLCSFHLREKDKAAKK